MNLGFIGTGKISTAVVECLALESYQIFISRRGSENSERLAKVYENVFSCSNQEVVNRSDVVFIGLTADKAEKVLRSLKFFKTQLIVSFMAAVSDKKVNKLVHPATLDSIMIPWPAIKNKGSPVLCWPNSALIKKIFQKSCNVVEFVKYAEFEKYLIAQAILSPILQMLEATADWLAENSTKKEQVDEFLRSLVATTLLSQNISQGITGLSTKDGLNERLRIYMDEKGLFKELIGGLQTLYNSQKKQ